ncbi:MAG: DUF3489 domain-containing protein [Rhodospirillales bacterium]|nr:DUF3489 domain-containing protein [Rhodospirillales bacterium]
MPKLTENQRVILSTAARRKKGTVLPLAKSLEVNKAAGAPSLKSLIKRGLIAERKAASGEGVWRKTKDGEQLTLIIAIAGLTAIGVDPAKAPAAPNPSRPVRPSGKQSLLLDLLRGANGASIDEMSAALGWQAHSVRGAIAGTVKKKLGFAVTSERIPDRGRVYRITTTSIVAGG